MASAVRTTTMVRTLLNTCRDFPSDCSLNNRAVIATIYKIFMLYYVLEINQKKNKPEWFRGYRFY